VTKGLHRDVRLLFRVDPLPLESPRGYLCRVAQEHNYVGSLSIVRLAGLPGVAVELADGIDRLSHVLRLETEEWRTMCYRHIKGRRRHNQRLFCGERISADDLNYGSPRLCPACLRERPIWWAVWDLGLVTACPIHQCLLFDRCPACGRKLAWQRVAVHQCRCGLDFRDVAPEPSDKELVAINAAIYRAAGFSPGNAAETALASCGFPAELLGLRLGALLRLVLFVGSMKEQDRLRRKQQHFAATNLAAASEIGRAAATMLGLWPWSLRAVLRHMLPPETGNPAALKFNEIFGNFYRHLFRVLPRNEFGFLHAAFERFVIEDWKGLIRGQHRYFSAAVQRSSHWVTVNEAERIARMTGARILDLVRQGQVDAIFLKVRRDGSRTECWIRRESLKQWIAARDAELAPYMARPEAKDALGLTIRTIVAVAAAGVIRYVKGPDRGFPARRFFFLREDVLVIKDAFERHSVSVRAYSKPGEVIALRHAVKNYLGHGAGLAVVIRAVVDGALVPTGRTTRFRGITGYLFRPEALRKFRPAPDITATSEGFLNYKEAAALLEVRTDVIRGLTNQGLFTASPGFRNGFARLIPAKEVQQFAERYLATSILAKRFHLDSGSLTRYLKELGTPLLAIPLLDAGRSHAYFLRKDVAAQIQLPSRGMLKQQAQCRIVAARKKQWEEYRQAREAALGRPLRRVRASCKLSGMVH
jgi:TniQ